MYLCNKCEKELKERKFFGPHVLGDGYCDIHKKRYSFSYRKISGCPYCAKEKGMCQRCGYKVEE